MIIIPRRVRCVLCRGEFYVPAPESCCPTCMFSGTPMSPQEDVVAEINWQELRILTSWAEQWVRDHKHYFPDAPAILSAIVRPLQEQYPTYRPLLTYEDPVPPIN